MTPGINACLSRTRTRFLREDDGFGLIEVMVSAVIIVVIALATLSLLDKTQQVSSNNRSRDVAAQLAQSAQDSIRQLPITQLAGGWQDSKTVPVGNLNYQVDSSAEWVQDSGGPVTCSTSGAVSYLATTTAVTWTGMGSIKPVTADAIVDPGVAALGAKKGALTVLLSRADGTGAGGVTVTVEGQSAVTDENGCAVIGNLDVGNQTLTYSDPNFVNKDSLTTPPPKVVTIGAGTIAQTTALYDNPGRLDLSVATDPAADSTPAWNKKYTLDHAQRTTPTVFYADYDNSDKITTLGLFPFASSYKAYAGNCTGNDPSNSAYTNAGSPEGVQLNPGGIKPLALTLPTAKITVDSATAASSGAATSIVIVPETGFSPMSGCSAPAVKYSYNTGAVSKDYLIQVPYGIWRVCANYKYGTGNGSKWSQKITTTAALPNSTADQPIVATTSTTTGTYVRDIATKLTMPAGPNTNSTNEPTTC